MRTILALFVCFLAVSSATQLKFDVDDFLLVAKGVFEGIGTAEGWNDVAPCLQSSEDAVENIIAAVQLIEKKDAIDVARGLADLGKALEDLPTALQSCGATVADVEKLVQALKAIVSPTSFFFHVAESLLVNGVQIYHEVYGAVDAFKASNWELFGSNIGEALAQIFLYGTTRTLAVPVPVTDALLFLKGVIEGISADTDFNSISSCFTDVETIGTDIDQAVNDFIAGGYSEVLAGIKLVGQAVEEVPQALQDCQSAYAQIQALIDAIKQLTDPRELIYRVGKSLILHGHEIYGEVTATVQAYRNGDFEGAGKEVGIILDNFISPDKKVLGSKFANFVGERASFEVDNNNKFSSWSIGEIKSLLGTQIVNLTETNIIGVDTSGDNTDIPENFSAYEQWPECKHPILDQGQCGSCWAFGASEALSDRFCIASQGKINVQLSPQYLVSCAVGDFGCSGGMLTVTWLNMQHYGLPTLDCAPYASGNGSSPSCSDVKKSTCSDGSQSQQYYYLKPWSTRWFMNANSIKKEIMTNGPVESAFTVYEDFMTYKSGVYKYTTGSQLGGHAIKIVGWGSENGEDYWLVANSWGADWGLDGFFKIGLGECGIDGNGVAGQADVEQAQKSSFEQDFLFNF